MLDRDESPRLQLGQVPVQRRSRHPCRRTQPSQVDPLLTDQAGQGEPAGISKRRAQVNDVLDRIRPLLEHLMDRPEQRSRLARITRGLNTITDIPAVPLCG